jgi:hypothetical protein
MLFLKMKIQQPVTTAGVGEVLLASPSLAAPAPAVGEEAAAGEVAAAAEEEVARDLKVSFKL